MLFNIKMHYTYQGFVSKELASSYVLVTQGQGYMVKRLSSIRIPITPPPIL
jgi:hypothetical protein